MKYTAILLSAISIAAVAAAQIPAQEPTPSPSGIAAPPEVGARQMRPHQANTKNEPSGETDGDSARYISDQSRSEEYCVGICAAATAAMEIAERRIAADFIRVVSGRMRHA